MPSLPTCTRYVKRNTALGFYARLKSAGFEDLGVIIDNDARRIELLALLDDLFATGTGEDWVAKLRGADIVSAPINTLLEASNDPDVIANGHVTEIDYPKYGKRLKVHGAPWQFSETPARPASRRSWASTTTRCSASWVPPGRSGGSAGPADHLSRTHRERQSRRSLLRFTPPRAR